MPNGIPKKGIPISRGWFKLKGKVLHYPFWFW